MSEEWGPWIEHDGKGCPCVGRYVQVVEEWHHHITGSEGLVLVPGEDWDWSNFPDAWMVVRYRIRQSTAFESLRRTAELPTKIAKERVDQ